MLICVRVQKHAFYLQAISENVYVSQNTSISHLYGFFCQTDFQVQYYNVTKNIASPLFLYSSLILAEQRRRPLWICLFCPCMFLCILVEAFLICLRFFFKLNVGVVNVAKDVL